MSFGFRYDSTYLLVSRSIFSSVVDPAAEIGGEFPPPQVKNWSFAIIDSFLAFVVASQLREWNGLVSV